MFIFNKMDFVLLVGLWRSDTIVRAGRDAVSGVLLRGVCEEGLVGVKKKGEL
mgnify:FL=1